MLETGRKTLHNTGFVSGGLKCLDNIDERALCLYSSVVLVDPACAEFSETRPNAKTVTVGCKLLKLLNMKIFGQIILLISFFSCISPQKEVPSDDNYELLNYLLTDTVNIRFVTDGYKIISDKEFPPVPCLAGAGSTIEMLSDVLSEKDTSFLRSQLRKSISFRTDSLKKFGFVIFKASVFIENKYSIDSLFDLVHKGFGPGLLSASMPIFNKEKTIAYFRFGYHCGPLCGGGKHVVLEKRNNKWFIKKIICAYVV